MPDARLEVTDALGRRIVPIGKEAFGIGRRETNDLRLAGSEVSRDHAEIVTAPGGFVVRDKQSRYGTYVNDEPVTETARWSMATASASAASGGAELVFLLADTGPTQDKATTTAIGDLRQIAALLDGLRALGSGRVLDDVLALVLDSAIEVTGAERGFIMLANPSNDLEFKLARGRRQQSLPGTSFATSRKIPEEVFRTGEPKILADLLDGELANVHMGTVALGIRNVQCVPLKLVRYVDRADEVATERRIGVLYLDSREKGSFLPARRAARSKRWRPKPPWRSRTPVSIGKRWRRRRWSRRCGSRPRSSRRCSPRRGMPAPSSARRPRRFHADRSAATSTITSICRRARSGSRSATWPARARRRRSSAR